MVKEQRCEESGDTKWRVSLMMLMILIATMWRRCGDDVPVAIEPRQNCFQRLQVEGREALNCEVSCDRRLQPLHMPC